MAEETGREHDDARTRRRDVALPTMELRPLHSQARETPLLGLALASEGRLHGRGSSALKATTLSGLQSTHGNRAVQRFIQRTISVQRCGDTPCGCSAEEKLEHALHERDHNIEVSPAPLQRWRDALSIPVQRQPGHVPAPADPNYTGTTGGDAYVGPGGGAGIAGLVSYGCYCGPGGDAITGSRCGPGAAPKDDIDAQCMRHDSDYNRAGVDSGNTPGTVNMATDLQGWLKSEEADRRLADSVDREMDANPGAFSPSARLYGQGIKGIFGGRANISHAMNWGIGRAGEAEAGVTGAYNDVTGWGSNKASEAEKGISSFIKSAGNWGSIGDAASGLAGGASDAANWLGTAGSEAFGGATKALGSAGSWLGSTIGDAAIGLYGAQRGLQEWTADTVDAIGNVGIDLAGRGLSAAGDAISGVAGGVANRAAGAWDEVSSWF